MTYTSNSSSQETDHLSDIRNVTAPCETDPRQCHKWTCVFYSTLESKCFYYEITERLKADRERELTGQEVIANSPYSDYLQSKRPVVQQKPIENAFTEGLGGIHCA